VTHPEWPPVSELTPGCAVGRPLRRRVGCGGIGVVYEADDRARQQRPASMARSMQGVIDRASSRHCS
jgi:hypothetical protein